MEENNHEQLEKILHSIAQDAKPDKNFEQMLKVKLRERFHTQHEIQKTPLLKRIWRLKVQLTSTLVLVLFSSTTIYAYNSDNVTNGSILYPLKRSTENIEGLLATTPEAKTTYYNKMATRRMRELTVLETKGIKDEATIQETKNLLTRASAVALELPNEVERESIKPEVSRSAKQPLIQSQPVSGKREKALEEISKLRKEFEIKFDNTEKQPEINIPITTPTPTQTEVKPEIRIKKRVKIEPRSETEEIKVPVEITPIIIKDIVTPVVTPIESRPTNEKTEDRDDKSPIIIPNATIETKDSVSTPPAQEPVNSSLQRENITKKQFQNSVPSNPSSALIQTPTSSISSPATVQSPAPIQAPTSSIFSPAIVLSPAAAQASASSSTPSQATDSPAKQPESKGWKEPKNQDQGKEHSGKENNKESKSKDSEKDK